MSEQRCSFLNNVVLKFAVAMARSAVRGEEGCNRQNNVMIASATATSTGESGTVLSAGE